MLDVQGLPTDSPDAEESGQPATGASESYLEEQAEITATFKRMLSGSRRLRRDERAASFRAARNWLSEALKALAEKRAAAARARRALRQAQSPRPSQG